MSILDKFKSTKKEIKESGGAKTAGESGKKNAESGFGGAVSANKNVFFVKRILVTEKSARLSDLKKYVFVVDKKINKPEIAKAIETIYPVKVASVNVINVKGKQRRMGRSVGKISGFKKAVVSLKEGEIEAIPA